MIQNEIKNNNNKIKLDKNGKPYKEEDESLIQNRNENYGNDFNNTGRQMNELSSNTSNNIINENN